MRIRTPASELECSAGNDAEPCLAPDSRKRRFACFLLPVKAIVRLKGAELISNTTIQTVNRAAVRLAFLAICIGVISAVAMIWSGSREANVVLVKILGSSAIVFGGSALTLCTVKYFYSNRESNRESNRNGEAQQNAQTES